MANMLLEAAGRLPPAHGAGGLGRAADGADRAVARVQGPPQADPGAAAGAAAVLRAAGRGVRLPQLPRRGQGGGRRHRHAVPAGGGRRPPGLRGLDRPRRLPARLRPSLHHDDPAWGLRRRRLHARPDPPALRHRPRADPRLHRPQGRHLGQHPRASPASARRPRPSCWCSSAAWRAIYGSLDQVRGEKRRQSLREAAEDAEQSKRLATIDREIPTRRRLRRAGGRRRPTARG